MIVNFKGRKEIKTTIAGRKLNLYKAIRLYNTPFTNKDNRTENTVLLYKLWLPTILPCMPQIIIMDYVNTLYVSHTS